MGMQWQARQMPDWEEDGMVFGAQVPEQLAGLGFGMAEAAERCLVGYAAGSDYAKASAYLVCGAIAAAGGTAILMPEVSPVEMGSASVQANCGVLLHLGAHRLHCMSRGLLPLTAMQWQTICNPQRTAWQHRQEYGNLADGTGLKLLYATQVQRCLPKALPMQPEFPVISSELRSICHQLFAGGSGSRLTVQLASDGMTAALYTEQQGWIFYERLLLLVAQQYLAQQQTVALPYWVPPAAERMAAQYGGRVLRYASASTGDDVEARSLALEQGFTLDALVLVATFLRLHAESEPDLQAWLAKLPTCHTVRRIVKTEGVPAMGHCPEWASHATPEGIRASHANGEALLRPSRSGRSLTIMVEAASLELASELAGDLTARLQYPQA